MAYRCVIFDFDGTLADTESHVFNIYNDLADKYHYRKVSKEELHSLKSLSFKDLINMIDIPYLKIPKRVREGQKLMKKNMSAIEPFQPNLKEVLLQIRSKVEVMGIITSNIGKNVKKFIDNEDINFFDFIISTAILGKEKKIEYISKKYKINPCEILYIGDETRDVDACKTAQVSCAAVTWGYNYPEALLKHNPDYIINDLEEILQIL